MSAAEPRRIAYLVSRFPKSTETFVLREAGALLDAGFELELHALRGTDETLRHPEMERLEGRVERPAPFAPSVLVGAAAWLVRHPLASGAALFAGLRASWRSPNLLLGTLGYGPRALHLAGRLRRSGVQHLHAHFANHPTTVALMVGRASGLPYSFTAHGSDLHVRPVGLELKVARSRFAVTISEYNRRFMEQRLTPESARRVRVRRCGVDLQRFRPAAGAPADGPPRVLCVAALREVKGHSVLFEALAELVRRGRAFRAELVGEGPLAGALRELAKQLGIAAHVEFAGACSSDEVLSRLGRSTVLVLASIQDRQGRREGIPVSLMEGMAAGVPCVASRISGIPELIEDGVSGLLFEPGSSLELASALERVFDSPELARELGRAGRQVVEQRYDLVRNAAELVRDFLDV